MPLDLNPFILARMKLPLVALSLLLPVCAFADGGLPTQPYIYVEGEARTEKTADMAILTFDLVTRNADQAKANLDMQAAASKVFALLDGQKVAQSDIIAGDIKSEPWLDEGYGSSGRHPKLLGRQITRSFAGDGQRPREGSKTRRRAAGNPRR